MPTDIDYPFSLTETGDVETVSGREFYEQHAFFLGVQALGDASGTPLTADRKTEILSQIERTYQQSEYLPRPITVSLVEQTSESLTISVRIGPRETIETTLPLTEST